MGDQADQGYEIDPEAQGDDSRLDDENDESDSSGHGDVSDNRRVTDIRVVVHNQGLDRNTLKTKNHWTISLIFSEAAGNGSARVNMRTKDEGKTDGVLVFSSNLPYKESTSEIEHWNFPVVRGDLTFTKIQIHILKKGRHRYKFHEAGPGCRYWVWRVMKDFAESAEPAKGNEPAKPAFISENAAEELWPILEKRYSKKPGETSQTTYLKMVEGSFIDL